MKESELLRTVLDYLSLHRIVHTRLNSGGMPMRGRNKTYWVRMAPNGWADILCLVNGVALAIECKVNGNEQSQAQVFFQRDWERAGGHYCLARSLEDVEKALKFKRSVPGEQSQSKEAT